MPVRIIDIVGTACRVLKRVVVRHSPRVHRVNFTQCAKLKHEKMIDEVCTNPPERSRLIVIRPMQNVSDGVITLTVTGMNPEDVSVATSVPFNAKLVL